MCVCVFVCVYGDVILARESRILCGKEKGCREGVVECETGRERKIERKKGVPHPFVPFSTLSLSFSRCLSRLVPLTPYDWVRALRRDRTVVEW